MEQEEIEMFIDDLVKSKMAMDDYHIRNIDSYLIQPSSKHDVKYSNDFWHLPNIKPFRSLREIKTFIKNNYGMVNMTTDVVIFCPIRTVKIKGVFTLTTPSTERNIRN